MNYFRMFFKKSLYPGLFLAKYAASVVYREADSGEQLVSKQDRLLDEET